MNELFLSYARENKAFVQKLYSALGRADHESWVDWEGIPPSAEWRQQISSAIEAAQAFIFVISPDSVVSEICRQELAQAVDNNKRLIPVVYQDVGETQVPEALGKLNWVFFRESDDFDGAFQRLLEAIDTDLEWVRGHTRLLVRAREWDNERQDKSFTLRGRDLQEAEEWLAKGAEKEPKPTGLQTQYVIASRRAATRRQTITLSAVTLGFFVAVVLAAVAFYQYTLSEERRQIAVSRQLAAQAANRLDDQLDLAMLLSVEAYRTRNTIEARRTLFNAVQHNPRLIRFLHGHTAGVLSIAFSPDGTTLASGGWDNTIRIWDVATGQPIGSPYAGHTNHVHSVGFSPDGKMLASGSCAQYVKGLCEQGEIRLIDVKTRRLIGTPLTGHTDWVYSVAFSPDGKLLASGSSDNTVRLWDVTTGRPIGRPLTGHTSGVVSVAFSPGGKFVASASWDHTIRFWDVVSGQPTNSPVTGYEGWPGRNLAFSPSGSILAASGSNYTVRLWDVATGQPIGDPLTGHSHQVSGVAFSLDGKTLVSASRDGTIALWDAASRLPIDSPLIGHTNEVLSVAFSPNGDTVASGDRDGGIILWNLTRVKPLAKSLAASIGPVSSISYTPDGALVSLEGKPMDGRDERLTVWDLAKREPLRQSDIKASILSEVLSPDGRMLATSTRSKTKKDESTIILWDVATGGRIGAPLTAENGYVRSLAFNREGNRLAAGNEDGSIVVWDVVTQRPIGPPLKAHTGEVEGVVFGSGVQILASSGSDRSVRLWDLASHSALGDPLVGHAARVTQILFSPDDRVLASSSVGKTSEENTIILWDVETRNRLGSPFSGQRGVGALAFSSDGRILTSANGDGTISLFDVATRQPIGLLLSGQTSGVNTVAFGSSSPWLASASGDIGPGRARDNTHEPQDGTITLWDMSIESWVNRACKRANRNLSAGEEWGRFVGDEPYRRTCLE